MKYIQFGIMAVLMFSLALSPAFSNGLAFAQVSNPDNDASPQSQQSSTRVSTTVSTANSTADAADRDPLDRDTIVGTACSYGQASTVECPRNPVAQ